LNQVPGAPFKKEAFVMLVTKAASYAEVYNTFRWALPERYNIAWDVCDRHAAVPDKLALIHQQSDGRVRHYTFREMRHYANQLANVFLASGLTQGDRVMLLLAQHPVTAFAHVACWKAGLVSVPASILFGVDALEYRLKHSGAKLLITDLANVAKIQELRPRVPSLETVLLIDGKDEQAASMWELMLRASDTFETLALTPDTPAFINYTSGTTGWPKGALQGHRSMLGHMPGVEVLYDFYPQQGDLLWSPADWSWLAGLMDVLMPAWFHGKPVLTYHATGFDAEYALSMMGRHNVRNVLLTPTVLKLIRQVPDARRRHGVNLRSVISGSEAVGKELLQEMNATFNVTINEGFGQTECNMVLGNCASLGHTKIGSLGSAMPGHIAAIVDDWGIPLSTGELGNIAFKRPDPVMLLKYWENEEATQEKFADDWLITGDLGMVDEDGFFWFKGRTDDLIKSSGYRIGPAEIEDAISRHPSVVRAAVIGVPDEQRSEIVKAFVVLADNFVGSEVLKEEIRLSVRDRLAKHEYPREIEFVDSLPMTTTGKVMRRELRDRETQRRQSI
jgi:acetyl-CoA synthetase